MNYLEPVDVAPTEVNEDGDNESISLETIDDETVKNFLSPLLVAKQTVDSGDIHGNDLNNIK